ncbi:MarR family winged helix-turn-helix transcriptional regulator [Psychromonas ossibalaenae]|uniref:MarR family winged helix-turn-helix transcriptional regulator n=1 Tax=Psychromonas ossibalaenae TaxID=444922 RepID=UPI00037FEAED|nr:MarR family transcriptional regulator [Psychromonas ossibalaenae]
MSKADKSEVFTNVILEIFKLGGLLISEGDQLSKEYGTTSARWKVLGAIALADSPQTVSQIAKTMGLSRQAVQRLVDVISKEGLLEFRANPVHKKARLISLSDSGMDIYAKLDKKQVRWAKDNSLNFSKKDLQTTLSVLKDVSRQFEP